VRDKVDYFLDITADVCPLTFVRTKLLLERMAPGGVAEIRLGGAEPLANVPRALTLAGHEVLVLEAEDAGSDDCAGSDPFRPHRLIVRKAPAAGPLR
jgi:TusA-related sulfurtransferase